MAVDAGQTRRSPGNTNRTFYLTCCAGLVTYLVVLASQPGLALCSALVSTPLNASLANSPSAPLGDHVLDSSTEPYTHQGVPHSGGAPLEEEVLLSSSLSRSLLQGSADVWRVSDVGGGAWACHFTCMSCQPAKCAAATCLMLGQYLNTACCSGLQQQVPAGWFFSV
jgi:hypothetical protein